MIVLGIHCGHDSSCAVVKDGRIIADVQEERFNRIKHSANVPVHAIGYCLEAAGLTDINAFDAIGCSSRNTTGPLADMLNLKQPVGRGWLRNLLTRAGIRRPPSGRRPPIYQPDYTITDATKFHNVEHHLAHAASAHYTRLSPEKCLVFTIDGSGDHVSTAVWEAQGSTIRPLQKLYRGASIGWAYAIVTEALHWWPGDGEGKTMGLAPYGDPSKCRGVLDRLFPVLDGPEIIRPSEVGTHCGWRESGAMQFHFSLAREIEDLCRKHGRENIAAEAQRKLEECVMAYVFGWGRKTGIRRTAYAGGVFMNVKLNQRIWNARDGRLDEQHIFPNSGDSGLGAGVALELYYRQRPFKGMLLDTLYLGPEWADAQIEEMLRSRSLRYERVEDPSLEAAALLAEGKIVGWYQGRMESGPRALGNRSILMSPCKGENKDIINARVKYREGFRPFCPSILHAKRDEYLRDARDEYFMITSFDVAPEMRDRLPAVVHVDGTVRPQLVTREMNERYWRLIDEFGRRTGVYAILNTSMNIKGEPIVNSPADAIRCFFDTGIDVMFLGSFVLRK